MDENSKMGRLVNKIERRLGTRPLNLPDNLKKDKWASEVICTDTLDTFSRYFPHMIRVKIKTNSPRKDGYFLIDQDLPDHIKILGVRDIAWDEFSQDTIRNQQTMGMGIYDYLANGYGMDDIALLQMRADHTSLFNNGIYIDYRAPNMIKLLTVTGAEYYRGISQFPLDIFVQHPDNLSTIAETKMETFENLAISDVASFLFNELKYYEGLSTVFADIDIKLADLEQKAAKREDVVQYLSDNFVTASNKNMPFILTI